jgi:hypothetical protein
VQLALGQRKDDWLACWVIWATILCQEVALDEWLLVFGGLP